jgi:thiazole/oxazole-forming peptide maturase SagC family component
MQLVETGAGLIVKRGAISVRIEGENAADVVFRVLQGVVDGLSRDEIRLGFAEPDREAVETLFDDLLARGILLRSGEPAPERAEETSLDVFYWNFGARADVVAERVNARRITVLGINEISRRLVQALEASGVDQLTVVDYQLLRNVDLFDESGELIGDEWVRTNGNEPVAYTRWAEGFETDTPGCIVATSDFGWTPAIREWNRFCVVQGCHFLPAVLHDMVGFVGPLVVPGHGACYECLRARQNSHAPDAPAARELEERAFEGQRVRGFHPSMAGIVGDLAAMELTKFYADLPLARISSIVEVNLMAPSLVRRQVLKLPRCTVCSPLRTHVTSSLDTSIYRLNG